MIVFLKKFWLILELYACCQMFKRYIFFILLIIVILLAQLGKYLENAIYLICLKHFKGMACIK